jgi:putative membrane protein
VLKATPTLLLFACLIFVFSCNSSNNKNIDKQVGEQNEEMHAKSRIQEELNFIVEAATNCLMEVELGQMAQQKGLSPKVKEFGLNMETDHSQVLVLLQELSARKNITLPIQHDNKQGEKLLKLNGDDFDRKYIKLMVDDHEQELGKYNKIATEGKDPETKAFAAGQLDVLKQHLDMAKAIESILK